jgi:hypothetical protein
MMAERGQPLADGCWDGVAASALAALFGDATGEGSRRAM